MALSFDQAFDLALGKFRRKRNQLSCALNRHTTRPSANGTEPTIGVPDHRRELAALGISSSR
jgi:hypothetical protein